MESIDQQQAATRNAISQLSQSFEMFMKLVYSFAVKSGGLVKAQQILGEASDAICRLALEHTEGQADSRRESEEMATDSDQGIGTQTPEPVSQDVSQNGLTSGRLGLQSAEPNLVCLLRTAKSPSSLSQSTP